MSAVRERMPGLLTNLPSLVYRRYHRGLVLTMQDESGGVVTRAIEIDLNMPRHSAPLADGCCETASGMAAASGWTYHATGLGNRLLSRLTHRVPARAVATGRRSGRKG
jgi:hypothetical protein